MQTKLTLRLDEELIERAKLYAKEVGNSVSQLVADYFSLLDAKLEAEKGKLTPIASSLRGGLREVDVDLEVIQRDREGRVR